MTEHIDMPVAKRRESCNIFIIQSFPLCRRRIQGFNLLTLVVNNVIFKDGKQEDEQSTEKAA
jgi:hypothetical protein